MDSLGVVDTTSSDYPAAMVFIKEEIKNYVVDNTTTTDLLVNFSDGEQFLVPAKSIQTKAIANSACMGNTSTLHLDNLVLTGSYIAQDITTKNEVIATTKVTLRAKNSITLSNGFHAQTGSEFLAIIEDCTNELRQEEKELQKQYFNKNSNLLPSKASEILIINVYPNPFNDQFTISYFLPTNSTATIYLTNILGQKVWHSKNKLHTKGDHQMIVSIDDLAAGTYFIVLKNEDTIAVRQMVRL